MHFLDCVLRCGLTPSVRSFRRILPPEEVDVKRIRAKAGMSQAEFARAFCINPRTLQEWEQGRRKPDATTRAYLAVIAKNRGAVLEALAR
jgi:putative transcriptional regulator